MSIRLFFFFFFKQKTAYEITYGDWSSDGCSSDLHPGAVSPWSSEKDLRRHAPIVPATFAPGTRSEERRVGKECRRLCRSRGSLDHEKKKIKGLDMFRAELKDDKNEEGSFMA